MAGVSKVVQHLGHSWAYWFYCGHRKRNCKSETHWCHWYNRCAVFHVVWVY